MKAVTRLHYCSPEKIQIKELTIPSLKPEEILVKVKATTVNRTDCGVLTGYTLAIRLFTGLFKPQIPITGTDFSGIVVARGERVESFQIGDTVYGFFDQGLGSHAEYVAVSIKRAILRKPEQISFEQAVESLEGAHYAYYFLKNLQLEPGVKVMVNGGTGAIGNAAIQFLHYYGVEVTATCSTDYVETVKSLGVKKVIDYTIDDFTQLDEQFDYVFDAVGKSCFKKCKPLLKPRGVYISSELGPNWQNLFLGMVYPLMRGRKRVKFPVPFSIVESMTFIDQMLRSGRFKPLVDRHYSLSEISDAFLYVMSGQKKGNVIIRLY